MATTPERHGGGTETVEQGNGASGLQEYQQRFEKLMEAARKEFGRRSPEVLDKLAATAKNVGQRLEEMSAEARRTQQEKEATRAEPVQEPPGGPSTGTTPESLG
jgi:hypothetical protein